MSDDRKLYTIEIYGIEHTVLLSDEDAKKRGLTETAKPHARNKARTPETAPRTPRKPVHTKADD